MTDKCLHHSGSTASYPRYQYAILTVSLELFAPIKFVATDVGFFPPVPFPFLGDIVGIVGRGRCDKVKLQERGAGMLFKESALGSNWMRKLPSEFNTSSIPSEKSANKRIEIREVNER